MEDITTAYYLRLLAVDRPGVLARVATILAEQGISIEALIQKEATEGELVPIILLTHRTKEKQMNEAIREIESMADIAGPVTRIRVESLDEGE
ncbi:MAG: ACT domain-containing protein, partial [Halomonas sp.]